MKRRMNLYIHIFKGSNHFLSSFQDLIQDPVHSRYKGKEVIICCEQKILII